MSTAASLNPRQAEILDHLARRGFASTTELAAAFDVSDMTIRRDTKDLARRGMVRVVRGGVSLPPGNHHSTDFSERGTEDSEAKQRVAAACQRLISPRETIIIDAGTTCFEVSRHLPSDFRGTIVTNSTPVIQEGFRLKSARTLCLGGELLPDSQAFTGDMTTAAVSRLRAQKAFIGTAGVHENGLYVDRDLELPTKRALIGAAEHVVVVATRNKMNHSALVHLSDFGAVDTLVTDAPPPPVISEALANANVAVIVAD